MESEDEDEAEDIKAIRVRNGNFSLKDFNFLLKMMEKKVFCLEKVSFNNFLLLLKVSPKDKHLKKWRFRLFNISIWKMNSMGLICAS